MQGTGHRDNSGAQAGRRIASAALLGFLGASLCLAAEDGPVPKKQASGIITTVAGTGEPGYSGDGGPATQARLAFPEGLAFDGAGNLYIADSQNDRVRKVDMRTGIITTAVRGSGISDFAVDGTGNLYIAESTYHRVRKVDVRTGIITTVAGTGEPGYSGDGGPAMQARLQVPLALAFDGAGNLYIADAGNALVRKVDVRTGIITTVAGTGEVGYIADGVPATQARLQYPEDLAVDGTGNLYIADTDNHRVRKVDVRTGIITTVAGTGEPGHIADGVPATQARLARPSGLAVDGAGNLYIVGYDNARVRKVDVRTGIITAVAGTGEYGSSGDGGPATQARLSVPGGLAFDGAGNLYIADAGNHRVRMVSRVAVPVGGGSGGSGAGADSGGAGSGPGGTEGSGGAGSGGAVSGSGGADGPFPLDEFLCRTCDRVPRGFTVAAFRDGNFSELEAQVIDPVTDSPFPNNFIPVSRLAIRESGAWPEAIYERNARAGTFHDAAGRVARLVAQGWTPLHEALANGSRSHPSGSLNPQRLNDVLAAWAGALAADLRNIGWRSGWTPLHLAAYRSRPYRPDRWIVKYLLEAGASVDARDLDGRTPLHNAASREVFEELRAAGADIQAQADDGLTILHPAARLMDAATVRSLIAEGLDPNAATDNGSDFDGSTPLMWAGSREVFEELRSAGANVHALRANGWTVLHRAVGLRDMDAATVRSLIAEGLDPNAATRDGVTPLHNAASREVFEALLELGADRSVIEAAFDLDAYQDRLETGEGARDLAQRWRSLRQVGRFGDAAWFSRLRSINPYFYAIPADHLRPSSRFPLHYAARHNEDPAAIGALIGDASEAGLLNTGASYVLADALASAAAGNGNPAVVEALLEAGANANANEGRALLSAARNETPRAAEIVRALLSAGADVDGSGFDVDNGRNNAPVYVAALSQNLATLDALIAAGANVDVEGSTPHYSLLADVLSRGRFDCGYAPVAERLRSAGARAYQSGGEAFTPGPQVADCAGSGSGAGPGGATAPGVITTVAGTGEWGSSGDGGPATQARLFQPTGLALDGSGNLYIADRNNDRVRKVDAATGVITTVAGKGEGLFSAGYSGDGGAATQAQLDSPTGLALDGSGNLYIADRNNGRVRKVDAATGVITTVAGTGEEGYSGDGGAATQARLNFPGGLALDGSGNLYIADSANQRVRKVNAATGLITTVAGTGEEGYSGDGGAATQAQLDFPTGLALDGSGNLYIADGDHQKRVRKVDGRTGIITTVAGPGGENFAGDLAVDGAGNLYIEGQVLVRKVDAATGLITTVAGTGEWGYSGDGDGGPATQAQLNAGGVAVDSAGNLYIADTGNHRVRIVSRVAVPVAIGDGSGSGTGGTGTGVAGSGDDHGDSYSAATEVPLGSSTAGITGVADNDWFRFRLAHSSPVEISLTGSATGLPQARVFWSSEGVLQPIGLAGVSDPFLSRSLPAGIYHVLVVSTSPVATDYILHVRSEGAGTEMGGGSGSGGSGSGNDHGDSYSAATEVQLGSSTAGIVEFLEQDWFRFRLARSSSVEISLTATGSGVLPLMSAEVYRSSADGGADVASPLGSALLSTPFRSRLLPAGMYYVLVGSTNRAATEYTLHVRSEGAGTGTGGGSGSGGSESGDDHGDSVSTATEVPLGSSTAGIVELGDMDVFRLRLDRSATVEISISGNDAVLQAIVYDKATLSSFDSWIGASAANIPFRRSLAAGTYYVAVVAGLLPADYTLHVRSGVAGPESGSGGSGLFGDPVVVAVDSSTPRTNTVGGAKSDWFRFRLDRPATVEFWVTDGDGYDYNATGTLFAGDELSGAFVGDNRLRRSLAAGTHHVVVVVAVPSEYTLHIRSVGDSSGGSETGGFGSGDDHGNSGSAATEVQLDSSTAGIVEFLDLDWFRLRLDRSATVEILMATGDADLLGSFVVYDRPSTVSGAGAIGFGIPNEPQRMSLAAGTYYVVVQGLQNIEYTLHIRSVGSSSGGSASSGGAQ